MIDVIKTIVKDLKDIFPANSPHPKTRSTFLTYNILQSNLKNDYTACHLDNTRVTQPQFVLSINSIAKSQTEAIAEAQRAIDYFKYHGYDSLKSVNAVVVDITPVADRTSLIVNDYEFRYGFDVFIRKVNEVVVKEDYIEKWEVDVEYE